MNVSSSLDYLFNLSQMRHEKPLWLSQEVPRRFVVCLTDRKYRKGMIVSEQDNILSFSMEWLTLTGLDDKSKYKLAEYALASSQEFSSALFFTVDRELTTLWVYYRVMSSVDATTTVAQYDYARTALSHYIEQPIPWQVVLRSDWTFQQSIN